jgi:hypothetical protein
MSTWVKWSLQFVGGKERMMIFFANDEVVNQSCNASGRIFSFV